MKTEEYTGQERRRQTRKIIDELLQSRQRMWSMYCTVAGLEPFGEQRSVESLKEFRRLLIDYISRGHFGIYRRIGEGQERRTKVLAVAEQVYPAIVETTDFAANFNDRYEKPESPLDARLSADLSRLGEQLATRFELEDRLIASLIR